MGAKYQYYDFLGGLPIPVSQNYGDNPQYYSQFHLVGHEGTDFAAITGTKLYCPFEKAIVVREGINIEGWKNYGEFIVLWDAKQKIALWFCHLERFLFNVNDVINKGDIFAITNNTGNTSGEHVHVNFCETDEKGVRLNQDNGMLGFLNLMDQGLIECLPMNMQITAPPANINSGPINQPQNNTPIQQPASKPGPTQTITLQLAIPATDNPDQYMGIKKDDFTALRVKCDLYDPMLAAGYPTVTAIDEKIQKLVQEKADMQKGYEETLAKTNETNQAFATENKELIDEKAKILDNWRNDVQKDSPTLQEGINAMGKVNELEQTLRNIASSAGAKKPTEFFIFSKLDELLRNLDYFKRKAQKLEDEKPVNPIVTIVRESKIPSWLKVFGVSSPLVIFLIALYYGVIR